MPTSKDITKEQACESVIYDPDTGIFTRKIKSSPRIKAGDICNHVNWKGYIEFYVCGYLVRAHRLAFLIMTGNWPNLMIDHIDGNKQNNKWSNLREVDNRTNSENRKKASKNNSCGFAGVSFHKSSGKYQASIFSNGKEMYLGLFDNPEDAHAEYMRNKIKLHKGYVP